MSIGSGMKDCVAAEATTWLTSCLRQLRAAQSERPPRCFGRYFVSSGLRVFSIPLVLLLLGLVPVQSAPTDAFTQNHKLGRGVNIIGYDPLWWSTNQARFKEKHFRLLKDAGFDSVRINLHHRELRA